MVVTFIRTLIIYVVLVIVMRLMGKSQIGEMQPFEFVVTLIIADLACIPMADVSIPLTYGIVSILAIFILHQLLSFIEKSGNFGKALVCGKPSLVLNKDGVDIKELKKNNLGVEDLMESMRTSGYYSLDNLEYAIFESNGKLSAFPKKDYDSENPSLPLLIVNEGKINKRNLELSKLEKSQIENFIAEHNSSLKNTQVLTVDGNGKVYFQSKNKHYELSKIPLKEGVKW